MLVTLPGVPSNPPHPTPRPPPLPLTPKLFITSRLCTVPVLQLLQGVQLVIQLKRNSGESVLSLVLVYKNDITLTPEVLELREVQKNDKIKNIMQV